MVAGTLIFGGMGITQKQDFFLLLGNLCCLFGNAVFQVMIYEENRTWSAVFGSMCLLSIYALGSQYDKFRRKGCPDDDDTAADAEAQSMIDEEDAQARDAERDRKSRDELASAMGAPRGATSDEAKQRIRNILSGSN